MTATSRRRTFGPVVLVGILASGAAAFCGSKPWAVPDARAGTAGATVGDTGGHVPLAAALGLVALACWGVVLVTRGVVRRVVAALGAVAALGLVVTAVVGRSDALASARRTVVDLGGATPSSHLTAWWWLTLPASIVAVVAAIGAVLLCGAWPEMGRRYDAPTDATRERPEPEEMSELDLWRALDDGRDPTDRGSGPPH